MPGEGYVTVPRDSALSTPRISLDGPKTAVRACVRCLRWCVRGGRGRWVPGVGAGAGYREGWYTGYYTQPVPLQDDGYALPRTSSPGTPLQGVPSPGFPGECLGGSSWGLLEERVCGGGQQAPGVPADAQYPPWDQYGRDSMIYILKLVHNPECHCFLLMRPAIVPISKTGSKVTTLNFQESHIR